jgi:hypothetical protein
MPKSDLKLIIRSVLNLNFDRPVLAKANQQLFLFYELVFL